MLFENTTVFDVETTGLDPENNQIIEIAAYRFRKNKRIGTFAMTVNPECEVPAFITNLTGITNEDVMEQSTLREVLPFFMNFIGDSLLVAHNAAFDLAFLQAKVRQYGVAEQISNDFIDTRTICIEHFPYQSHKLEVMCNQLGISLNGAHRALNDVDATYQLLAKLNEDFGDAYSFKNLLYFFRKYEPPAGVPEHSRLIAIGK